MRLCIGREGFWILKIGYLVLDDLNFVTPKESNVNDRGCKPVGRNSIEHKAHPVIKIEKKTLYAPQIVKFIYNYP